MLDRQHTLDRTRTMRGLFIVAMTCVAALVFIAQPMLTFAASGWQIVASPNRSTVSFSNNTLFGVTAVSDSDVWAVGNFLSSNNGAINETLIEHWNGTKWSIVSSPNVPDGSNTFDGLLGITVSGPTSLWSVGGFDSHTGERTLTLHNTQG